MRRKRLTNYAEAVQQLIKPQFLQFYSSFANPITTPRRIPMAGSKMRSAVERQRALALLWGVLGVCALLGYALSPRRRSP